jgi:hypothetical protein
MSTASSRYGGKRISTQVFGGKTEGKKPLGRPKQMWDTLKWMLNKGDGRAQTGLI